MFYYIFVLTIMSVEGQNCPSSVSPPVSICGDSVIGRIVYLSGIKDGEGDHTCQCSLTLESVSTGLNSSGVEIIDHNNITSSSCDYSLILVIKNKTESTIYNCSKGSHLTRRLFMSRGEEVLLKLRNGTFNNAGLQLCLQFSTRENVNLRLNCSNRISSSTPGPSTTTTNTRPTITSTTTTEAKVTSTTTPISTAVSRTTSISLPKSFTNQSVTPTTVIDGNQSVTPTTVNDDISDPDVGLIVGAVLAVVVVIVVIFVIIFCIVKRKKKNNYDKPSTTEDQRHSYINLQRNVSHSNQTSHNNQGENNQQPPEDAGSSVYYTNVPNYRIDGRDLVNGNLRNDLETQYDSLQTSEQVATPYYTTLKLKEENDYIN